MSNVVRFNRRGKTGSGARMAPQIAAAAFVLLAGGAVIIFAGRPGKVVEVKTAPAAQEAHAAPAAQEATDFSGVVTRVIDGDSIRVSGQRPDIRLWGLDAPEWDDQGGAAATAEMTKIALSRPVRCRTVDRDKYGRIVARCYTPDGADITEMMIESGTAEEYLRFSGGYYARRKAEKAIRKRAN